MELLNIPTGEGNGNPLQCSCLENPMDGGAWWAAICGVTQSRTWLKRLSSSSSSNIPTDKEWSDNVFGLSLSTSPLQRQTHTMNSRSVLQLFPVPTAGAEGSGGKGQSWARPHLDTSFPIYSSSSVSNMTRGPLGWPGKDSCELSSSSCSNCCSPHFVPQQYYTALPISLRDINILNFLSLFSLSKSEVPKGEGTHHLFFSYPSLLLLLLLLSRFSRVQLCVTP